MSGRGRPGRALAGACAALALACASHPALEMPAPLMALPDTAQTRAAILAGLARRGWTLEGERAGSLLARWEQPPRSAELRIDYDLDRVHFRYAGSSGFDCTPPAGPGAGGPPCLTVQAGYNKLLHRLRLEVERELALRRAALPPP